MGLDIEIKENSGTAVWGFAIAVATADGELTIDEVETLLKSFDVIADFASIETELYGVGETKKEFEINQLKIRNLIDNSRDITEAGKYLTSTNARNWAIGLAMVVSGADDLAKQENDLIKRYIEEWGLDKSEIGRDYVSFLDIHIKYATLPLDD